MPGVLRPPAEANPVPATLTSDESRPLPIGPTCELARGTTLGRFVVLDRIGAGGMGVVYSAYDYALERKVALKLMRADVPPSSTTVWRERLLREAQAMARLSHPNVRVL